MRNAMVKKPILFISMIVFLLAAGCIKETYNMNTLSKKAHLSPEMALSAINGDISFSDIVKKNDTIRFDQNNFVTIVFRKDALVDLKLTDFVKGTFVQATAPITPQTIDLKMDDLLSHITGDFRIVNPTIKFYYTNSFTDEMVLNLNVTGKNGTKTVNLLLPVISLLKPDIPVQTEVTSSFIINNSNTSSTLSDLVSLPPNKIDLSGTVKAIHELKGTPADYVIGANRLLGSLEIEIPLELKLTNLQFCDTLKNFLKSDNSDDPLKPQDFKFLRVNISAQNGFPLGASLKMSLYNSTKKAILKTVNATGILEPAPVDSNGKADGTTDSGTTIEFTTDFFSSVNDADKIIFWITLNTTGTGTQNVKIYSDYHFIFNAALVVKPDISLNLNK